MIADLRQTISKLNGLDIAVVLLGPSIQFKARLPSMLMRAHWRQIEPHPEDGARDHAKQQHRVSESHHSDSLGASVAGSSG